MQIQINGTQDVQLSDALEGHIRSKLTPVERHFGDRVTRVEVFLKDVNADKGGFDKSCTLEAHPAGLGPVAVEAQDADLYTAVHDAAGKLDKALEHRTARAKARR